MKTLSVLFICIGKWIDAVGRVFVNGPGDQGLSQVELYQRLKKWYLILPCLTLSIIRFISRVKWSNPRKRVEPSPTSQSLKRKPLGCPRQQSPTYYIYIYIYIYFFFKKNRDFCL